MNSMNSSSKFFIPMQGAPYCMPNSPQIIEAEEYSSTLLRVISPDSYKNQWPIVDRRSFIPCPDSMKNFGSFNQMNSLIKCVDRKPNQPMIKPTAASRVKAPRYRACERKSN